MSTWSDSHVTANPLSRMREQRPTYGKTNEHFQVLTLDLPVGDVRALGLFVAQAEKVCITTQLQNMNKTYNC